MDLRPASHRMSYVRGARVSLLAIIIGGIAAVLVAVMGPDAAGECAASEGCLGVRLPASLAVATGSVSYRIARDGALSRIANVHRPFLRGASWFPATDTWYLVRSRHLVIGRGRRVLWRSHHEMGVDGLGVIAAGGHAVAFQRAHMLYLARDGGAARPVARRELPLGWTPEGLFTYSYPRRELLLRSDTGTLLRRIARRPLEYEYDLHTGSLYFVRRGVLLGARGTSVWRPASLRSLGLSTNTWLQPLGRLIELLDDRRLVVVRPGGSVFASTSLPRDGRQFDSPSSSLAVAPHAHAVAFTVALGRAGDPSVARRAHGTEIVYVLRANSRAATAIHRERIAFWLCEREAGLQWHGSWLLYSNTEGTLTAIDTAVGHRAIELSRLVRRLIGARTVIDVHWST